MLFSDIKETSGLVNRGRIETKFNIFVINKFLDVLKLNLTFLQQTFNTLPLRTSFKAN